MKRTAPQQIGDIITELLKQEHLDVQLDEHRAVALWPEVVGKAINGYTVSCKVEKGVMYVRLTSAPLRNEMMLTRSHLIKAINKRLGRDIIKEIIFR